MMIKGNLLKGQTLLELMFALALSAFLLLLILTFYSQTGRQNTALLQQLQLQTELHKVVQLMAKDLRRSGFLAAHEKVTQHNVGLFALKQPPYSLNIIRDNCVLFFYDLNADGCIGKQKSGICIKDSQNATKEIERELFGYRWNVQEKMLETRSTYKSSVSSSCEGEECQRYLSEAVCADNKSGWTNLLDGNEYMITDLHFKQLSSYGVEIRLVGSLKNAPENSYEVSAVVPLINEITP